MNILDQRVDCQRTSVQEAEGARFMTGPLGLLNRLEDKGRSLRQVYSNLRRRQSMRLPAHQLPKIAPPSDTDDAGKSDSARSWTRECRR